MSTPHTAKRPAEQPELLRMEGVHKTFPGVVALDGVDFDLRRGEVHVLLGENGAGKSTLIKMLSGAYRPDGGRVFVDGTEVRIHNTQDAARFGIATICQEFNLVPDLSVAENIFLGRQPRRFGMIDRKRMNADAAQLLARVGLNVSPQTKVRELGIARLQMVEIAKALSLDARVLIMDEPTAVLTAEEVEKFFRIVRQLRADGVGIVFITHHLEEIAALGVQAAVTAILAFGVTFVIVSAGIDLSVGSVAALSAAVLAWTATAQGLPVWLSVVLAVGTGIVCGLVSGALISFGRLPPFIATLAMLSIGRGLALVISDGSPIAFPDPVSVLGDILGGWLPVPVIVMTVMGVITSVILVRTYIGRSMYAIGGNEEAARLSGIRVKRQKLVIYALSGAFAAVAGIVLASRLASAGPQAATGYELDAIAAVVIGGASLSGGVGKASGTFIGALILAVLRNGLNLLSVSAFWQQVMIGVVIALAVLLDTLRRRA